MLLRWFPWRYVVSRVARARGLIDPVKVLSRLESFAQPLQVKEPLELLRAGMVFHARGLLNTGAIQHNLDWVWPFWVERQYDPGDDAFIPRAFSITHVNLTHRNWTAVGLPDFDELPLVDPRGLVTPFWDGWSLDFWALGDGGEALYPSRRAAVDQELDVHSDPAVVTRAAHDGLTLTSRVTVDPGRRAGPELLAAVEARGPAGWLAVSLRPFNPEGVSFVEHLERHPEGGWRVDGKRRVAFDPAPDEELFSTYGQGDVATLVGRGAAAGGVRCPVGMASAAALFRLEPGSPRRVEVRVPLAVRSRLPWRHRRYTAPGWAESLEGVAELRLPDPRIQLLYDAAVRTLVLHSPGEVYPGPFTYKRFWFRDAAFILDGLLALGLLDRVERTLDLFPGRQTAAGHFLSQEGEWDSNGEALWILDRFCRAGGRPPKRSWRNAIRKGARWIAAKRLPDDGRTPHSGLLPPGFSAEHLGPNDYYYWDDFWSIAGLRCAARLLEDGGEEDGEGWIAEAAALEAAVDGSLRGAAGRLGRPAMPASPYRRLDSGAVGSLAGGYPLQLLAPRDERLLDSADYLLGSCFFAGGFFQDVIHSGINPYLTLHVAQVLLRAGDPRGLELVDAVAGLATPTGQWPEAIHPRTGGGCMGDGQHAWAAAEWVLVLRNAFVREEGEGLVLGGGIAPEWIGRGELRFGPTPTSFGPVTVEVAGSADRPRVIWQGDWRGAAPPVEVRLPGCRPAAAASGETGVAVERTAGAAAR